METEVIIQNPLGIHSRPAGAVMKMAALFPCNVRLIKADKEANGKSIVSILALEMNYGDKVVLKTSGEQEEEALRKIEAVLSAVFE